MKQSLCALLGAASLVNAGTFKSSEQLLQEYAPVFESETTKLQSEGFKTAPLESYFAFGNAEINPSFITNDTYIHDKGKSYESYGAFPINYDIMKIWGPGVGFHPREIKDDNGKPLTEKAFNERLKTDVEFNVRMTAIRLSGLVNGNPKDSGVDSFRRNYLSKSLTDVQEAYVLSYIGNKRSKGLRSNWNKVLNGTYEFPGDPNRDLRTQDGIKYHKIYEASRKRRS